MSVPNKFPGPCKYCGLTVEAGAGVRWRTYARRGRPSEWLTAHKDCHGVRQAALVRTPTDAELYEEIRRRGQERTAEILQEDAVRLALRRAQPGAYAGEPADVEGAILEEQEEREDGL